MSSFHFVSVTELTEFSDVGFDISIFNFLVIEYLFNSYSFNFLYS